MANQSCTYEFKEGKNLNGLISAVDRYLSNIENMETQRVTDENNGYTILQARAKGGKWKQIVGMDKAITIRFIKKSYASVCMEIGEAKWADKGTVMAVSMFVLWPLAVTSGIGMYQQGSLPKKIKNEADKYMGISSNTGESAVKKPLIDESTVTRLGYAASKIFRF